MLLTNFSPKEKVEFAKVFIWKVLIDKEIASKMKITYATACDYRVKIQKKQTQQIKLSWLIFYIENLINLRPPSNKNGNTINQTSESATCSTFR